MDVAPHTDFAPEGQRVRLRERATTLQGEQVVRSPSCDRVFAVVVQGHVLSDCRLELFERPELATAQRFLERANRILHGALVGWCARSHGVWHHAVMRAEVREVTLVRTDSHLTTQHGGEQVVLTEPLGDATAGDEGRLNATQQRRHHLIEYDYLVAPT